MAMSMGDATDADGRMPNRRNVQPLHGQKKMKINRLRKREILYFELV